jgi:hypothetical protein
MISKDIEVDSDKSAEFTRRESNLVHTCQKSAPLLKSPSARQHILDGFQRRILLMQTSRFHIEKVSDPTRQEVLNTYACSELNVHLNSFFIHLRGGLDNLAWALHYEFGVLGDKDERDIDTRRKCSLFDSRFLDPLGSQDANLSAFLRTKRAWFDAFKELRDPVAHRVPLYAMPGVIHEGSKDAELVRRLNEESSAAFSRGDFDDGRNKLFEAWSVGKYEPWFTQYAPDSYTVRDIRGQISSDLDEFLTVAESALAALFSLPGIEPFFR